MSSNSEDLADPLAAEFGHVEPEAFPLPADPDPAPHWLWKAAVAFVVLLALYYGIGAWRAHGIGDDPGFTGGADDGQSRSVAVTSALLFREVEHWTPNKPFFYPAAVLRATPGFQRGLSAALSVYVSALSDLAEQDKPDNAPDPVPDLSRAAELLSNPPDVWMFDPMHPFTKTYSTEKQYRNAARSLLVFNQHIAAGSASFPRSPAALKALLEAISEDLDHSTGDLEALIADDSFWPCRKCGEVYYQNKGRAYADYLLIRDLGEDFGALLSGRDLGNQWAAVLDSLRAAASPRPLIVANGRPDALLTPNHLAMQGFLLLRAHSQLDQIAESLR